MPRGCVRRAGVRAGVRARVRVRQGLLYVWAREVRSRKVGRRKGRLAVCLRRESNRVHLLTAATSHARVPCSAPCAFQHTRMLSDAGATETGLTTNMISNRATYVAGIDTAPEVVEIAAARHPHLAFRQMDGLDTAATAGLAPAGCTFSLVCIDISGERVWLAGLSLRDGMGRCGTGLQRGAS